MATRVLLIMCEGKTEKAYFDILTRIFRIPMHINIQIYAEEGQHKALVDRGVEKRRELAGEFDISEEEIETWAVCDDDNMPYSYQTLLEYAEQYEVELAFSKPQFEYYILQHFEPFKLYRQSEIYERMAYYRGQCGATCEYGKGLKADLGWLENMLIDKPKLVSMAIRNSNERDSSHGKTFLTVQRLTQRLYDLDIDRRHIR